jgi:predicted NBD/HSP70 family sugar kinase
LGLRHDGTTAIDVERLLAAGAGTREAIGAAVAGVVAAVVALADPLEVVVGGSWGPQLIDSIRTAAARMPRPVPLRAAEPAAEPVLAAVRADALRRLRSAVVGAGGPDPLRATTNPPPAARPDHGGPPGPRDRTA